MLEVFLIFVVILLWVKFYRDSLNQNDYVWISIEGIIGAGKTTLIKSIMPFLEKEFGQDGILVVDEPVDEWIKSGHLENCTKQPYVAQTYFFHTRVERFLKLTKESNAKVIISERSMISDRFVFWDTTCKNGLVTDLAQKTYPALWHTWTRLMRGRTPDIYIYLELDVDNSQKRMRERNRTAEKDVVSNQYQKQLVEAHEKVFLSGKYNTVKISSKQNFRDDEGIAENIAKQIRDLIVQVKK